MATDVSMVKCACADCVCVIPVDRAVRRDERLFCSDSCADHHRDGTGCGHAGCTCHG
ncbi:MAG TPA: metallothionein [Crenalkalicoccus sp.]|nr:metallothionein [Crenalkalicoccus sp.]